MLNHIISKDEGYDWIDLTNPDNEELTKIAVQYKLHDALVKDCLQPDHLPKFEKMENYNFLIFRVHTGKDVIEADTVQELTNKVAIFYSEAFIITIHRTEQAFLKKSRISQSQKNPDTILELLNTLIQGCLMTYEDSSNRLSKTVDFYEQTVFLRNKKVSLLKGLYHLKRKIELCKRMLALSKDIIENIDNADGNVNTRDTRDSYVKLQNIYDVLSENIHQLLDIYFSASTETMRVLTIFSVFFMPLTFIVGIYGMNFEYMPELEWKVGYPMVILLMVVVTVTIYIWFRRKGWM